MANINERTFPEHPSGDFALCLEGSHPPIPAGAVRVDLPARKCRCVVRIELGTNPTLAAALQRQVKVHAYGEPTVAPTLMTPLFTNDGLPGAEIFEQAEQILASEADLNPGMEALQRKVRAVAAALRQDLEDRQRSRCRHRTDRVAAPGAAHRQSGRPRTRLDPAEGRRNLRRGLALADGDESRAPLDQ